MEYDKAYGHLMDWKDKEYLRKSNLEDVINEKNDRDKKPMGLLHPKDEKFDKKVYWWSEKDARRVSQRARSTKWMRSQEEDHLS